MRQGLFVFESPIVLSSTVNSLQMNVFNKSIFQASIIYHICSVRGLKSLTLHASGSLNNMNANTLLMH